MELKVDDFVRNIKRPYLTPFVIFTILLSLFFDAIMFFNSKLYDKLPLYLVVFLIFAIVMSILLYLQEKSEKVKVEEKNVIWYMTLNVITGYSMPLFIASTYVVGAAVNDIDVFYYWCGVALMLFISWLGLFLFYKNEFDSENPNPAVNAIAIIIKLFAFGGIFYISLIVPVTQQEEIFIGLSIFINIIVDALLVRSYFNYALYKSIKKDIENEGKTM
ncbi:TPA: DUF5079 family protein [Staphylococcus aureus]|uniref:DUF5079 family protein n=1 Tax=Staphylococcus aureus TaxID=1280 RepID=UPI0021FF4010|nr:DUF5079 family protein [Staphylococcus aureus]HCW3603558.1 DUF5079 family protein [Staphylococcus aureus]HCW3605940.1 DUF5079 family protein [Staphylococcus aureus]HDT6304859.1 DUF5079 family protein [Staphylococcus aureus]HDT6318847.1 DUF5079 family protein [Staphylococcus aureus]